MKKLLFGIVVILLLIGTIGCGNSAATTQGYSGSGTRGVTLAQPTAWSGAPAPVTVTQTSNSEKGVITHNPGDVTYASDVTTSIDRMVVYNAGLTIVAENITTALANITTLASNFGGFVVNSNIGEDQNRLYASVSFRVLSTHFNETIHALHSLAVAVKSETTTGEDVTQQYTDLTSKLRNLEASEAQLLDLMKKAGTVVEILAVQKELVNTREQIELIKGQMQYYEQSSKLALFTVTLEQSKLIVDFSADSRSVKEGNAVAFYSNVSGGFTPYTYQWSFGDGETSTEANPFHTYNSDGTFGVTVKITDYKGTMAEYTRTDYITAEAGWSAGGVVDGAWNALVGFGHFLGALIIGLAIFSPVWIVILAVILYFAWWRRRKNKKS